MQEEIKEPDREQITGDTDVIRLAPYLSYIPPTEDPLSANVVLMEGKDHLWVYDVGSSPAAANQIASRGRKVRAILSHFHPDHIANIERLDLDEIYQGKNTFGYTHRGRIVETNEWIRDGELQLHMFPIPSSHAKGSLALELNETWCFLGDAPYATRKNGDTVYNAGLLLEMIRLLEKTSSPYFLISHSEPFLQTREEVLKWLGEIAALRKPGQAFITV